jgi:hypothetical protein
MELGYSNFEFNSHRDGDEGKLTFTIYPKDTNGVRQRFIVTGNHLVLVVDQ